MMGHRFRMMHRGQRGITLPELLIVVVIIGLISGGIAMLISRTITGSARDSDRMILVRQVQQAGQAVSTDALQAQCVDKPVNQPEVFLRVRWDWDEDLQDFDTEVIYQLDGTDLLREHDGQERRVAQYITSISITPVPDPSHPEGKLTFTVTASFEGREDEGETRVYEVEPRPRQDCQIGA